MDKKISCIIPVYNEGPRVLEVIKAVHASGVAAEIIVVDDGSKDNTAELVSNFVKDLDGVNFITYHPNQGKSHAVKVGFEAAKNDYVMMIDSDLVGLDTAGLQSLAQPVINDEADVTISLRQNSLGIYKWLGIDFISGERVFKKDLIPNLDVLDNLSGFGLESYMNKIIISKKMRIKVVHWDKVVSPRKSVKAGWWAGMVGDFKMSMEIIALLGLFGVVRVILAMRRLQV